jgi:hypothetical protein
MNRNRLIALLAWIFCAFVAYAQPNLSAAVHQPLPGDTVVRTHVHVPGYVPGPGGPGQIFSFPGAATTGAVDVGVFVLDTGVAPWTYNMRADFDDGGIGYVEYFHITPDSLSDAGFDKFIPDFTPFERHNSATKLMWAFGYGNNFRDTYEGQHQSVAGAIPFTGTVDVVSDAWGDLILGIDTIPNVLRIHTIDTLRENFFGNLVTVVQHCYDYYSDVIKFPVLSACTDPQNGNTYQFYSAQRTIVTGIASPRAGPQISCYPNPFQGHFKLDAQADGLLEMMDLQGRQVATRVIHAGMNALDFPELPVGAYLAMVRGENGVWTRMVVKE